MTDDARRITAVAIVGSRKFPERALVEKHLNELLKKAIKLNRRLHIVSGGAIGVDTWAYNWAITNHVMVTVIPAEWDLFGKRAGYLRNTDIWDMAIAGIAFWDGESPGTQHSFKLAQQQNKKCKIVLPTDYKLDDFPW